MRTYKIVASSSLPDPYGRVNPLDIIGIWEWQSDKFPTDLTSHLSTTVFCKWKVKEDIVYVGIYLK